MLLDKSVFQIDPPDVALERRYKTVVNEKSSIKATFDRIRAQLAQDAEQRSRPVSRIYSGFRAYKAWLPSLVAVQQQTTYSFFTF